MFQQIEFLTAPADPDTERDAVARQRRSGADGLGDLVWRPQCGYVDRGEEPDPRRHRSQMTDSHPWIGPLGVEGPAPGTVPCVRIRRLDRFQVNDVVRQRERVISEFVGGKRDRTKLVVRYPRGRDGELHPVLPWRTSATQSPMIVTRVKPSRRAQIGTRKPSTPDRAINDRPGSSSQAAMATQSTVTTCPLLTEASQSTPDQTSVQPGAEKRIEHVLRLVHAP